MKVFLIALLAVSITAVTLKAEHEGAPRGELLDIYAIKSGMVPTWSTAWNQPRYTNPRLDATWGQCWHARFADQNQWIQVNSPVKKKWIGVETQGRSNANQWVKSYKVLYSNDGVYWD